jgi:hypothetical protein
MPSTRRVNAAPDARLAPVRRLMAAGHARPRARSAIRTLVPERVRQFVVDRMSRTSAQVEFPDGFVESFDTECRDLVDLLGESAPSWSRRVDPEDVAS